MMPSGKTYTSWLAKLQVGDIVAVADRLGDDVLYETGIVVESSEDQLLVDSAEGASRYARTGQWQPDSEDFQADGPTSWLQRPTDPAVRQGLAVHAAAAALAPITKRSANDIARRLSAMLAGDTGERRAARRLLERSVGMADDLQRLAASTKTLKSST
jgi:hypothetical protein